jgi:sec-independent protein translocase protein TatC
MPSLREYLGFAAKLLFAFGLIFELPLFIFFLARLGLITADQLSRQRKYAILLIFIVAAILTPPDVVTQILMAGPLWILFEISVWVARIFGKKKPPQHEEEETTAQE